MRKSYATQKGTWDTACLGIKEVKMTTGPGAVPRLGDPVVKCSIAQSGFL
jgi:hypothetical protein